MLHRFPRSFFFGNYFYGVCAVALSVEAELQQGYHLNEWYYFILVFTLTVWYYTIAYRTDRTEPSSNPRTNWYVQNKKFVFFSQAVCLSISAVITGFIIFNNFRQILSITSHELFLILITPAAALAYYGISIVPSFNLRNIGWLKPFVIGFTWAGLTTVYPVLYYNITHNLHDVISPGGWWLFLKNFMFVSVLCIMFDIKDYVSDANENIKTLVVHKGLKFTIFYIVIPLSIAGLVSFLIFSLINHFSPARIIINSLPFFALVIVAYSLQKRRSILFYLFIIDGLMFFKAVCGIIAYYVSS